MLYSLHGRSFNWTRCQPRLAFPHTQKAYKSRTIWTISQSTFHLKNEFREYNCNHTLNKMKWWRKTTNTKLFCLCLWFCHKSKPSRFTCFRRTCGWILAYYHSRDLYRRAVIVMRQAACSIQPPGGADECSATNDSHARMILQDTVCG